MTDDQLEFAILKKYVEQHKRVGIADPDGHDKCSRELDMRDVLRELIDGGDETIEYYAGLWHLKLAPSKPGESRGPLRPCSNGKLNRSTHRYHARAFTAPGSSHPTPAWDRIRELEAKLANQVPRVPRRELEQKFKILYSLSQAERDFDEWVTDAREHDLQIGAVFLDIDHFKALNTRYGEPQIDKTILPEVQHIIRQLSLHRGAAYRHGGEEFLLLFPNHGTSEVLVLAEKARSAIERHEFSVGSATEHITVSVGVAIWPVHAHDFDSLIAAANEAEHEAKQEGRNQIIIAG